MDRDCNGIQEERKYFLAVLHTFQSYRKQSLLRIENKEKYLASLPKHHKNWLETYRSDLESFKQAVEVNAEYLPKVLQHANYMFENVYNSNEGKTHSEGEVGTLSEGLDKVQNVFKQAMRDWSALGAEEREQCNGPIIEAIEKEFDGVADRADIRVLVPGAGLGRLAYEVAARGFVSEGNEFNLFMLIVSYHILNCCKTVEEFQVFPWIHQYCNNLSAQDQTLSVRFPDVRIDLSGDTFSMTAGDFLEVYTEPERWHCVATCFFIDCASNVVQFIERIYNILRPGGVWINLGPLLYHYSDVKEKQSIEPSFEVLLDVVKHAGFAIEDQRTGLKTRYCQNPRAMLQYEYDSVYFVCRKPLTGSFSLSDGDGSTVAARNEDPSEENMTDDELESANADPEEETQGCT